MRGAMRRFIIVQRVAGFQLPIKILKAVDKGQLDPYEFHIQCYYLGGYATHEVLESKDVRLDVTQKFHL